MECFLCLPAATRPLSTTDPPFTHQVRGTYFQKAFLGLSTCLFAHVRDWHLWWCHFWWHPCKSRLAKKHRSVEWCTSSPVTAKPSCESIVFAFLVSVMNLLLALSMVMHRDATRGLSQLTHITSDYEQYIKMLKCTGKLWSISLVSESLLFFLFCFLSFLGFCLTCDAVFTDRPTLFPFVNPVFLVVSVPLPDRGSFNTLFFFTTCESCLTVWPLGQSAFEQFYLRFILVF